MAIYFADTHVAYSADTPAERRCPSARTRESGLHTAPVPNLRNREPTKESARVIAINVFTVTITIVSDHRHN